MDTIHACGAGLDVHKDSGTCWPGRATLNAQAKAAQPFRSLFTLLSAIPGLSRISATTIVSEIGADMSRCPSAGHLAS